MKKVIGILLIVVFIVSCSSEKQEKVFSPEETLAKFEDLKERVMKEGSAIESALESYNKDLKELDSLKKELTIKLEVNLPTFKKRK